MLVRTLSPPASGAPAEAATLRRALAAVLRWRLRRLSQLVPAREVRAARLLPVLLHASFDRPSLRSDAPGVNGERYRRSWSTLARAFDLPPPARAQRGAALVEAVLALPAGERLELVVLPSPGATPADAAWIADRTAAAQAALAAAGARLELTVADPGALARDARLGHRLAAFGALAGGRLSPTSWAGLEAMARRPVEPALMAALAPLAPTPLAALALTLLSGGPAPAPLDVAARLLRRGDRARLLADPSVLAARWVAEAEPAHAAALGAALALASPAPDRGGSAAPRPAEAPLDAAAVLVLGRRLALEAARALRRAARAGVGPAARARWREALGPDLPRALLPALGARLAGGEPLRTELVRVGRACEVRFPGGAVLGRGATPVQARVRALSVLASAALEPLLAHAEPPWRAVAARLAQRRDRSTLILVVEPAGPSGPPFDPLNRGPERLLGFPGALALRVAPGRRPAGRVVTGEEAVALLVREALAGTAVEVLPARGEAHPVAARLAQLPPLLREARTRPVAIEAGGRVLLARGGRTTWHALDGFARRPRSFTPDPDSPDLALSPGERRPVGVRGAAVVECRAQLVDDQRAAVLYADAAGGHLRELVLLADLEEHLREARRILQAADPGAMLAVRLSPDVEPAVRRVGRAGAPVPFAVAGTLAHDVQVEVGGIRYGGASGRSWREAAHALLAAWPRGGDARLAAGAVNVTLRPGGRKQGGLLALYARGLVIRRLRIHLVRALRSYRPGRTGRREG